MQELERVAVVLKPTEKMLAWINENTESSDMLTLNDIRSDCTVLLLPTFTNEIQAEAYILDIYQIIFTHELQTWYEDENLWPKELTIELFLQWFDIEIHSMVYDVVKDELDEGMVTSIQ